MTNVISSAFDTVTTVEQGVELLDIFMHLSTREVIVSLLIGESYKKRTYSCISPPEG